MQRRFEINDPKLEQARNAVAAWRARRACLGPMPERLRRAAAALAQRYCVSRISSELQVNYARLRAHLCAEAPPRMPRADAPPPAPTLVELPTIPSAPFSECTIEIERVGGDRLTMRLRGQRGADLAAALGYAFVGRPQA